MKRGAGATEEINHQNAKLPKVETKGFWSTASNAVNLRPNVDKPSTTESSSGEEAINIEPTKIFNPYIHGTTSLIFSRLPKTDMQLMSPITMLKKYHMAPPGGEVSGGGLNSVKAKCKPCFGILDANEISDYTLEKIIKNYTSGENDVSYRKLSLEESLDRSRKIAFSDINILLIYLARARANEMVIDKQLLEKFLLEVQAAVHVYYLVLLLGKKIHPDNTALKLLHSEEETDAYSHLTGAIHTHLTFENILQKIIDNNLNVKEIYENPTPEGLALAVEILTLPEKLCIETLRGENKEVSLPLVNPFKVTTLQEANYPEKCYDHYKAGHLSYRLPQNLSGYAINDLLRDFSRNTVSPEFFNEMEEALLIHIKAMEKRIKILKEILAEDQHAFAYSSEEKAFLQKPFPVIFICEEQEKFELFNKKTHEYRAKKPLKIGQDIKMMATDLEENRQTILKFLREHEIENVDVVLFDQLRESKETKRMPKPRASCSS